MTVQVCEICGEQAAERKTRTIEYQIKDKSVSIEQPGLYCFACGETVLEPSDLKATRLTLTTHMAVSEGVLPPLSIRHIRKKLGLTQAQAAELCGGGKNAFSRYESGEVLIPKATSNLLVLLNKENIRLAEIAEEASKIISKSEEILKEHFNSQVA